MKVLKIIIERSSDSYSAYAENITGIYGQGDTISSVKKSIEESITLIKKYNAPKNIPSILKENYTLVFKFDTQSFLNYYRGIFTNAALERLTGIHQKQLQHYASGLKKPRAHQAKKIEQAMHNLGKELIAVEL